MVHKGIFDDVRMVDGSDGRVCGWFRLGVVHELSLDEPRCCTLYIWSKMDDVCSLK